MDMITNDDINNSIERTIKRFVEKDECELRIFGDGSVELTDGGETTYYVQADGTVDNYDRAAWDALQWEEASAKNADATEKKKYYKELYDEILYHDDNYNVDLKNILKLAIENDRAIVHVANERDRTSCEFSIGYIDGDGHTDKGNMNYAKEMIGKMFSDATIKDGFAIYPSDAEFGCPEGGERVFIVNTMVENEDIAVAEIKALMDCFNQNTVTIEFPENKYVVHLSDYGNKKSCFDLDKFELVFPESENTPKIIQEATELQLANQGIITTGIYTINDGTYSGIRNPKFYKDSELYHNAAIELNNMVEDELNRRNNSVELD